MTSDPAATAAADEPTAVSEPEASGGAANETLDATLARLRAANRRLGAPSYDDRIAWLTALDKALLAHKEQVVTAISADFGNRSRHETLLAEIFITQKGLRHAIEHLQEWMSVEDREVDWEFFPGRAEVRRQPKGVVGIISPWNYPVQLTLSPLVAAVAAGNRAMLKMSEYSPAVSAVLSAMLSAAFPPDTVAVVTGDAEVGRAFAALPFDHLLFTGSTQVGREVMRAASEHLTPLTLELGGKSPAIVGGDFSVFEAAHRIMVGKLFSGGQTCIAPDYALVPEAKVDAFIEAAKATVAKMYPRLEGNPDYTSIIHAHHYDRLRGYVEDARAKGGEIIEMMPMGETLSAIGRKFPPTLIRHPQDEMMVMKEEIFEPVLPIKSYATLDEALEYVNDRPRPLALYYFGRGHAAVDQVLERTISGGVCINDTMLHLAQEDLPFGGIGPSGMGEYHGRDGFETFSKKKGVFFQGRLNMAGLMEPPFGGVLDLFLRFKLGK